MKSGPSSSSRAMRIRSCLLLFLAVICCETAAQSQDPSSAQGRARKVEYDYTRGVDLSQHLEVPGEAVCDLKRCRSAAAREETKERAYETAFRRIDQMGRTYHQARSSYFESFHLLTAGKSSSVLREDIRFLKAVEMYDYDKN